MSNPLRIAVAEEKGNVPVTILHISGDLDSKTYTDLESKAGDLIGQGANNVLLDLGGVTFMGSAGLRAIHGIFKKLSATGAGGKLKLANPSDAVARVMKTLGFDVIFDIHGTVDEALGNF